MSSDNYIQDVAYPSSYNPNLNPLSLWFIAAINGFRDTPLPKEFHYCDLGCGDGTTLNHLAAMYPEASFVGVDFNADHITAAHKNAGEAGLKNVEFHQLDFADLKTFATASFDFITCFGAFSWINVSLQDCILDFAGDRLRDNGLFLVHYAAKPGKAQIDPLWHLMRVATNSVSGNSIDRVREGTKIINHLREKQSLFFRQNPVANERAKQIPNQNPYYVAHESLTEWQAFFHSEIANRAAERKLIFAGPMGRLNAPLEYRIPPAFQSLFNDSMDSTTVETLSDYVHNTGIRADLFSKEGTKIPQARQILDEVLFGISPIVAEMIPPQINTPSGQKVNLTDPLPKAMLANLAKGTMTFGDLMATPALADQKRDTAIGMLALLVSEGVIQPLSSQHRSLPENACTPLKASLPLTELNLSTDFPLTQALALPSAHTGQCAQLPVMVALILAAMQAGLAGDKITNQVVEKVWNARKELFAGMPNPPGKPDLGKMVNQQMQLVQDRIIPELVARGVFKCPDADC